jgi:hypothetical protein
MSVANMWPWSCNSLHPSHPISPTQTSHDQEDSCSSSSRRARPNSHNAPADRRSHCRRTWARPSSNFVRSPKRGLRGPCRQREDSEEETGRDCASPHLHSPGTHLPDPFALHLHLPFAERRLVTNNSPSPTLLSNPVAPLRRFTILDSW